MGLVTCSDCKSRISDAAVECPKCGRPISAAEREDALRAERRYGQWKWGAIAFVVLLIGVCSVAQEDRPPIATTPAGPVTSPAAPTPTRPLTLPTASVALAMGDHAKIPARCWGALGRKSYFGSAEQLAELQRRLRAGGCSVIAFSWRLHLIEGGANILWDELVAYDAAGEQLNRVVVDRTPGLEGDVHAETWHGATQACLSAADPSGDFACGSYRIVQDRAVLTPQAVAFVRQHAPAALAREWLEPE